MLLQPEKLNVLCLEQYSDLGGAQRTLLDLVPSFHQLGWTVEAVLPDHGAVASPLGGALESLGCKTYLYRSSSYTKVRKRASEVITYMGEVSRLTRTIADLVRRRPIDLIYVNGPRTLPAAAWVARRRLIPLVFHCHNRLHQSAAIQLTGHSLRHSRAHVMACCRFALEPLVPYVAADRFQVLYNGIAPSGRAPCSDNAGPILRIGVVGRVEEEKGQLEFVRAARILHQQFRGLQFCIIGAPLFSDGVYMEKVRAEAADLPVRFTGWRSDGESIYSDLDLLVVPSSALDATPRVILEAQEMSTTVVAFAVGGIPEIIRDGETGFLVHEHTPEALAEKIATVLRLSREQLSRVRERAAEVCRQTYSLASYRRNVTDFVRNAGRATYGSCA